MILKKIVKLKFLGHEVGKAVLENYLRWHNTDLNKKDKFLLFSFLKINVGSKQCKKYFLGKNYKFCNRRIAIHTK